MKKWGRSGKMKQQRKAVIARNEVSEVKTYQLGGYSQKVLIEGLKRTNPIILTLHGGPGMPIPFGVGSRGMFPELTDNFVLISWDQLGCGINNCALSEELTIDHFVGMVGELMQQLKQDYPQNPFILFGTSWGSILAAKAATNYPNLMDQVITYGQVSKQLFLNQEVYTALEQSHLPANKLRKLQEIRKKAAPQKSDALKLSQWVKKYTTGYLGLNEDKSEMKRLGSELFSSPDYRLRDFLALFVNGYSKNERLWQELLQIDLTTTLTEMTVPYTIVQGDCDIVTSTKAISEIVSTSNNPQLSLKIIRGSGHIPNAEGMAETFKEFYRLAEECKEKKVSAEEVLAK